MKRTRWLHALVISIVAAFGAFAIACGGNEEQPKKEDPFSSPAIGVYYYEVDDVEYLLSLNKDKTVALTVASAAISGKYDIKGNTITFTVSNGALGSTATYANDEVTLTYSGSTLKFLRRVDYTVTFNSGEGSAVESATVRNGKKLTKPDDPTYDGHVFIGWYRDRAATEAFMFMSDVVRGDLTLYAGWVVKEDRDEYQVKFDLAYGDDSLYYTATTVNGKVYDEIVAPTREEYSFRGWWLVDAESGEYSSRVDFSTYVFNQNETLYAYWQKAAADGKLDAPIVSVDVENNSISWDAVDGAASYNVKVVDPDGVEWTYTEQGTTVTYENGFTKPGQYTVEVYAVSLASADKNSEVATRKFINKQLARVSNFTVVNDTVLTFGGVENATKYLLYIDCGDEQHKHNPYDNGNSKEYNFGECAMQPGGIKFVVEAQAEGYVTSRSEEYVVEKNLDKVTGLKYDAATQTVSWTAVKNASSYEVKVECSNAQHVVSTELRGADSVSVDISDCAAGNVKVTVVAKGSRQYNSSESVEYTVQKTESAAVQGVTLNNYTLSWNKQDADKYVIDVNGVTNEVTGTSADLSKFSNLTWTAGAVYTMKVRAVKGGVLSSWSKPITASNGVMSDVQYKDGVVSWDSVFGASGYMVVVNDGKAVEVSTPQYNLTLGGKTTVVKVYLKGDDVKTAKSVTVNAYALSFDGNGTSSAAPATLYFAKGDTITLPKADSFTRRGYDLAGWYTAAEGNVASYTDGDIYDRDNDLTLYARWEGKEYTIRLNFNIKGDNTDTVKTVKVKFDEDFTFELPETSKSPIHGFLSWNTSIGGNGEDVTDEFGKSKAKWHYTDNNMMLYVKWGEIFAFEKYGEGNNVHYVVRKGEATTQVTEIEVPAEYKAEGDSKAYPVTVVGGNAFQGCSNLTKITIPSSVDTIEPTALTSLSKLVEMHISGNAIVGVSRYWSEDGVVFGLNPLNGRTQLEFFPRGRTGEYTMPEGIEDIPYESFAGTSITKLTVPHTVKRVAATAFAGGGSTYNHSRIEEIVFADPSNPQTVVEPLNIVNGAFKSMSYLKEVTFPSRTFSFVDLDGNESEVVDFKAGVFYGCNSLANVSVAANNVEYTSIDGMLCKRDTNGSDITVIFCPNAHVFENNKYVTNNSISIIGTHAFSAVKNLRELEVGASIAKIDDDAFSGYTAELDGKPIIVTAAQNLKTITFKGGRGAQLTIGRAAFGNESSTASGFDFSSKIACTGIENIIFEDGCNVTKIGNYAFAFSAMKNATFPTSLQQIGYGAFKNSLELENVEIAGDENGLEITNVFGTPEDDVTRAGLFQQCTKLESVHIPKCVTSLGGSVFLGCRKLTEVTVDPENPVLEFIDGILYGKNTETGKINSIHYVLPSTDMSHYVLPDGITEINGGVFANVGDQLRELTINKYVTYIGQEAFADTGIQKVVFLNKESEDDEGADELVMGTGVFKNCQSLTEVTLPARLKVLPSETFVKAYALESVTLPEGLEIISSNAFGGTSNADGSGIKSIVIPNTVKEIGYKAFYYCNSLGSVTFAPNGTERLVFTDKNGEFDITADGGFPDFADTFGMCCNLKTIVLPERLYNIGKGSFRDCTSLQSITIPTSVRVIGGNAFRNCSSLGTVTFTTRAADGSQTLKMQDGYADSYPTGSLVEGVSTFKGCTSLQQITLPEGLERIPMYTFEGCSALHTVSIPSSVHDVSYGSWDTVGSKAVTPKLAIDSYAFTGCSKLANLNFVADKATDLTDNGNRVTIHRTAFGSSNSIKTLTSIELPARYYGGVYSVYGSSQSIVTTYPSITRDAFGSYVQSLSLKNGAVSYSSANGMILSKDGKTLLFCPAGKSGTVTIPAAVTKIESGAFKGCANISQVQFANPAQGETAAPLTIGNAADTVGAFNSCTNLTSITFPERLSVINDYAFYGCTKLANVIFAGTPTITTISNYAFSGCTSLVGKNVGTEQNPKYSFVVPKSVTQIGNYTFFGDAALASVSFEGMEFDADGKSIVANDTAGLVEIGANAFEKSGLLSIYLPKSITTMGNGVFANCAKLAKASLPNTVTNLNGTFSNCGKLTELNLYSTGASSNFEAKNSIVYQNVAATSNTPAKKILSYYPMSLTNTEVTATDLAGTTEIGDGAFGSNRYLKKITIPNTVTKIGANAFRHCTSLEEVIFEADTISTETPVFVGTDSTELTIPDGTTTAGIFYGCYNLKRVVFPKRLMSLGKYNLAYLPKLEEVTFPDDCKMSVFYDNLFEESGMSAANGLSVNIPLNINEFKGNVFKNSNLVGTKVTKKVDGNDVTEIGNVVIPALTTKFGSSIFQNTPLIGVEFKSATRTNDTKNTIFTLGSSMFIGCTQLSSVTLPTDPNTKLGSSMFQNCTSLTEITMPGNIISIASSSFSGCTNLEKVNSSVKGEAKILAGTTEIANSAFYNCGKINKITLPDGLLTIGTSALAGMSFTEITIPKTVKETTYWFTNAKTPDAADRVATDTLTKVVFEDGNTTIQTIGASTFYAMPYLTSVRLPHGATNFKNIGPTSGNSSNIFSMSGITSIEIPKTVEYIKFSAFKDCTALETVTFEKNDDTDKTCALQWIGNYTFQNCTSLTEITIPKSAKLQSTATSYSTNIFDGCTSLTKVVFEKGSVITNIASSATTNAYQFKGCTSLTTVRLPENLSVPGVNLFQGCTALENIILPSGVMTIPNYTFDGCSSLKEVKFGNVDNYLPTAFATYQSESAPTAIGEYAFRGAGLKTDASGNKTAVLSIIVPPTVTSVGANAFLNSGLNSVTIMDGVTAIPGSLFKNCAYLTTVTIPGSVTSIGASAFSGCAALTNVTIPAGVTSIGDSAFEGCAALTNVTIPADVTAIGASTFKGCAALTGVTISANVTSIGNNAFSGCEGLTTVTYAPRDGAELTIGNNAFNGCKVLEAINLPEGVTSIGNSAYQNCDVVTTVTLPKSLVTMGNNPFINCDNLVEIVAPNYETGDTVHFAVVGGALYGDKAVLDGQTVTLSTTAVLYSFFDRTATSFTVPDGIVGINNNAFWGMGELTTLNADNDVSAFAALGVTGLIIGESAFNYCGLTSITLGENVTVMNNAFGHCAELEAITIPTGAAVDVRAFDGCGNLSFENITVNEDVTLNMFGYTAKLATDGTITLVLDSANHTISQVSQLNNAAVTHIEIAEGVTSINDNAFYNFQHIVSVVLPSTLTSIGSNAFRGATSLESINFPAGLTTIGNYAFYQCPLTGMDVVFEGLVSLGTTTSSYVFSETGINSITLPATFNYVGGYAFKNCTNLTAVYFDEDGQNVTFAGTIYYNWFENCTSLKTVTLPGNQTTLNKQLFEYTGLTSIKIPATVTSIGDNAFRGCADLADLEFATNEDGTCGLTAIPASFSGTGITSLAIPKSITEIKGSAFKDCTNLTSLSIPVNVTTLGTNVFEGCTSLATVTFEKNADGTSGLTKINGTMFKGAAITTISIPKNITEIGSNAFENCVNLATVVFEGYDTGDYALTKLNNLCFGNTAITEFVVPEKVTSTTKPFSGDKLTKITLSPNTTAVPNLKECTSLTTIIVPEGATSVSNNIAGMTWVKKLELPSTITTVGGGTFEGWTAEQEVHFNGLAAPASSFDKYWRRGCNAKLFWDGTADLENPKTQTTANLLAA